MPKKGLIDPSDYPADNPALPLEGIQELIPHRHEFTQVHSMLHFEDETEFGVGFRKGSDDEFWMRGHIPGRPMFPGALMIEAMAQTAIIHLRARHEVPPEHAWIGFAGVDKVRFRGVVEAGEDLWIPGHITRADTRRGFVRWEGQIVNVQGDLICEAIITGASF